MTPVDTDTDGDGVSDRDEYEREVQADGSVIVKVSDMKRDSDGDGLTDWQEYQQRKGQAERPVRARRAEGDERDRLWRSWADIDDGLDAFADRRSAETPVVLFEPRNVPADQTS